MEADVCDSKEGHYGKNKKLRGFLIEEKSF